MTPTDTPRMAMIVIIVIAASFRPLHRYRVAIFLEKRKDAAEKPFKMPQVDLHTIHCFPIPQSDQRRPEVVERGAPRE